MAQKNYNTIHDFLNDQSFKNWAFNSRLSDVSFWDFWLKNNPLKKELAFEARDILLGINFKKNDIPEEKIDFEWNKLETKLKKIQQKEQKETLPKRDKKFAITAVAASLLLLFSVSAWFLMNDLSRVTHKTAYGEVLELKLNDGTLVTLNSNSSISYKKNNARNVWLKGEAFFKVNKKESTNAKFWVNTNDLIVEVFGTQFNVNTQRNKTKVFLEEGNIWLNLNNGTSKKMIPGNYIEYSSDAKKILIDDQLSSSDEQLAWKNGTLIFNNSSLLNALYKVSDTYGVEFDFHDQETKNTLITGTVPTTNLEICLNAIKKSANVIIKKENAKLVVYKN
ncbi:ferric-dicitrate binding protein FerR, regulates iron transport through sigma-19 [Tenacibaculum sp. MAR_2009_124]|uniref:FecR family protein n=1 Tax=Tenacibaculum sp. MAR_2009_124 TaxID=1250059 RepID=UPI000897FBE6|nr:FecR family protein [Tenacibaculum sp. MAR_2009_124]SEB38276.1 ferric-dicitrate binding protein FerR, regulates iron transport through sigma-19 [Tenacibaculum sp. MAR_2009_124]